MIRVDYQPDRRAPREVVPKAPGIVTSRPRRPPQEKRAPLCLTNQLVAWWAVYAEKTGGTPPKGGHVRAVWQDILAQSLAGSRPPERNLGEVSDTEQSGACKKLKEVEK